MKVYPVLYSEPHEPSYIFGVYASKEVAEQYIREDLSDHSDDYEIIQEGNYIYLNDIQADLTVMEYYISTDMVVTD